MIAFPGMLVSHADSAGMKVPEDPDNFDANKYPHFSVYLTWQIGRPIIRNTSHWDNAKIIADIPEDKIKLITYGELIALGVE
jgi:hypothetical protein